MNKNTSMAAVGALAGILTLAVLAVAIPHQAFAGSSNPCCDNNDKKQESKQVATGGNGGSGGAGGAGGEGGAGGANVVKDTTSKCCCGSGSVDQKANGGDANGGHGGNANGGGAST